MTSKRQGNPMKKGLLPTNCTFFLADDIRVEQGGKTSMIGFYPDSVIIAQLPKGAKDPTKRKPFALQGLAILASFRDAFGTYELELMVRGPKGELISSAKGGKLLAERKGSLNFVPRFAPFPVVGFGKYQLVLKLNGKKVYSFSFEIRRGELDPSIGGHAFFSSPKSPSNR